MNHGQYVICQDRDGGILRHHTNRWTIWVEMRERVPILRGALQGLELQMMKGDLGTHTHAHMRETSTHKLFQ